MDSIILDKEITATKVRFSDNLTALLEREKITQKDFASKMEIAESTLSGYIKGKKNPNLNFLVALHKHFPQITVDQFLFGDINEIKFETNTETLPSDSDVSKYYGTYFVYYLDTSKRNQSKEISKNAGQSIDLRYAVMYIGRNDKTNSSAICISVFGLKSRDEAAAIKNEIEHKKSNSDILQYLHQTSPRSLYIGKISTSQEHCFISLKRETIHKDNVLINLHHFTSGDYLGGLGTINSISTGRDADPIVQLVAISRNYAHLSDEQIKSQLWFAPPEIHVQNQFETNEILRLAESLYSSSTEDSAYSLFTPENIKMLLNSYLEHLIVNNLEANRLWYGRVTNKNDDDWYHLLTESEDYYKSVLGGADDESTTTELTTDN